MQYALQLDLDSQGALSLQLGCCCMAAAAAASMNTEVLSRAYGCVACGCVTDYDCSC